MDDKALKNPLKRRNLTLKQMLDWHNEQASLRLNFGGIGRKGKAGRRGATKGVKKAELQNE